MLESDVQLVQRARCGDVDAFEEIFQRYQPVVYRFARGLSRCPAAAEDVSQEAFLALLRDFVKYDPSRATLTTYLYGIVRNLSRERSRKDQRFAAFAVLEPGHVDANSVDDPADVREGFERAAHVRRGLRALPARYREVIVLCKLRGLSYADAAGVVCASPSVVRSRLHRGRELLRQRLTRIFK